MGAARLTLPSCALTWARSAVLTNSACRSWVNGSRVLRPPIIRLVFIFGDDGDAGASQHAGDVGIRPWLCGPL